MGSGEFGEGTSYQILPTQCQSETNLARSSLTDSA